MRRENDAIRSRVQAMATRHQNLKASCFIKHIIFITHFCTCSNRWTRRRSRHLWRCNKTVLQKECFGKRSPRRRLLRLSELIEHSAPASRCHTCPMLWLKCEVDVVCCRISAVTTICADVRLACVGRSGAFASAGCGLQLTFDFICMFSYVSTDEAAGARGNQEVM